MSKQLTRNAVVKVLMQLGREFNPAEQITTLIQLMKEDPYAFKRLRDLIVGIQSTVVEKEPDPLDNMPGYREHSRGHGEREVS